MMADLDMYGHIDDILESIPAVRISKSGGSYINGIWVAGATTTHNDHKINVQAASMREIDSLSLGGERIKDLRSVHVNDGDLYSIAEADIWEFDDQKWKCVALDNRPWRNYCKILVSRFDVQS